MHYGLINSSGNVLEWFDDETEALSALASMHGASVDLLAFDDSGRPVGDPLSLPVFIVRWPQNVGATVTVGSQIIPTLESTRLAKGFAKTGNAPDRLAYSGAAIKTA